MLQPNFTPFPLLKTERLLLRQLTMDDTPEIFFLRSNEAVLRLIGKEPAASIEEASAFIKRINDSVDAGEACRRKKNQSPGPAAGEKGKDENTAYRSG